MSTCHPEKINIISITFLVIINIRKFLSEIWECVNNSFVFHTKEKNSAPTMAFLEISSLKLKACLFLYTIR